MTPPLAGEGRDGGTHARGSVGRSYAQLPPPQPSPAGGGGSFVVTATRTKVARMPVLTAPDSVLPSNSQTAEDERRSSAVLPAPILFTFTALSAV